MMMMIMIINFFIDPSLSGNNSSRGNCNCCDANFAGGGSTWMMMRSFLKTHR